MDKLTTNERCGYRGWAVDYAIRANTRRNLMCAVEEVAPIGKIMQDAQTIYDFIAQGSDSAAEIKPVRENGKS